MAKKAPFQAGVWLVPVLLQEIWTQKMQQRLRVLAARALVTDKVMAAVMVETAALGEAAPEVQGAMLAVTALKPKAAT